MTDHTSNIGVHRHCRTPAAEFRLYFAVIFAAALPFELFGWLRASVAAGRIDAQGPVARALRTARIITPTIFSA